MEEREFEGIWMCSMAEAQGGRGNWQRPCHKRPSLWSEGFESGSLENAQSWTQRKAFFFSDAKLNCGCLWFQPERCARLGDGGFGSGFLASGFVC